VLWELAPIDSLLGQRLTALCTTAWRAQLCKQLHGYSI